MRKDEPWLKKIKEQLDNYSEPTPQDGWAKLEKRLIDAPQATHPVDKSRIISIKKWTMVAAAAIVMLCISLIGIRLMQSQWIDHINQVPVISQNNTSQDIKQQTDEIKNEVIQANKICNNVVKRTMPSQLIAQNVDISITESNNSKEEDIITESNADITPSKEIRKKQNGQNNKSKSKYQQYQHSQSKQYAQADSYKKRKNSWSFGLSINNAQGLTDLTHNEEGANIIQQSPSNFVGENVNINSITTGFVAIPEGQELIFEDGLPYLRTNQKQITSIKHKQPLSFGLSLRKGLTKGLSLETGLTYTCLASDVVLGNNTVETEQKLHYLGIPLRANWNFLDNNLFTIYISAGGMIEKCIYGKLGNENQTVKPLQLSVMGAVGAQYNASKRIGIYLEPGISYYFDDGSSVQTIRKERPCTFTLQAGIRLTY